MLKRNALLLTTAVSVCLAMPLAAQDTETSEAQTEEPKVEMIDVTGDTVVAGIRPPRGSPPR